MWLLELSALEMLVSQGWTCWATSFPMVLVLIHEHWIFFYILMSSVKRLHCSYSPLFRLLWMGLFADLNFFPSLLINAVWKWLVSYMLIINLFYLATAESVYRNWEFSGCIIFSGFFFFFWSPPSLSFYGVCMSVCGCLHCVCLNGGFECPLIIVHLFPLRKDSLNLELIFHLAWQPATYLQLSHL